jgi:hypothetical protein
VLGRKNAPFLSGADSGEPSSPKHFQLQASCPTYSSKNGNSPLRSRSAFLQSAAGELMPATGRIWPPNCASGFCIVKVQ